MNKNTITLAVPSPVDEQALRHYDSIAEKALEGQADTVRRSINKDPGIVTFLTYTKS